MIGYGNMGSGLGMGLFGTWMGAFLLPLLVWSVFWKGWALWKAAKADSKIWFVILLLVNTVGILEILYIFMFSETETKKLTKTLGIKSKSKK